MKVFWFKWLTAVFAVVLMSSFVSMMASFIGSEGNDLRDLLILQTGLIPLAMIVAAWCLSLLVRRYGYPQALKVFWQRLPGWLLFAVLAANSLVLIAELSFFLLQHHTGSLRAWQEHVPAVTALSSSLALALCYVSFRLADEGP